MLRDRFAYCSDVVFEVAGAVETPTAAASMCKKGGTLCITGICAAVSFQWKYPDFLLRHPNFLLKNVDFVIITGSDGCAALNCGERFR